MNLIELANVSYLSPTTQEKLIDSVSFAVPEKTITTIIGPNGAGKSTLLRLILGLIRPSFGRISRIKKTQIGYMPQRLSLNSSLPLTVERFLLLSKPLIKNKREQIETVLKQVNADYTIKNSIHTLSGGEWQRVLLARALLQSPNILVLDEPVQGLDLAGQAEFYRMLHQIKYTLGCTVVQVSHDLHLVWEASDTVICLNKHICCMGHPDHVRQNKDVQRLFGGFIPYRHHHDHCHDGIDHSTCEHEHV